MNNGVANDALYDLWKFTLSNYDWSDNFEVLFPQHQFLVCDIALAEGNYETAHGGTDLKRQLQLTESGTAVWTQPAATRSRHIGRVLGEVTVPWCAVYSQHTTTMAELRRNMGKSKLKSLTKSKRIDAMLQICKAIESKSWATPDDATDKLHPWGFPYWLPPITGAQVTAATYGHQGTVPFYGDETTYPTTVAGINPTTYSRWRSYNDVWDNSGADITEDDCVKIGRMLRRLHWRSPRQIDDLKAPKFQNLRLYTDEAIIEGFEKVARSRNDNLGADVARFTGSGIYNDSNGNPMVKGFSPLWVEELDTTAAVVRGTHPFYAINHGHITAWIEEGCYFQEDTPPRDVEQPDTITTYVDLWFQFLPGSRQALGGNISYVAAA